MASKRFLHTAKKNNSVLKGMQENWRLRRHLALAYRLLDRLELNEGACNHLTVMAPAQNGSGEVMLVVPGVLPDGSALHWSQVTASSLIGIDANQNVVEKGSLNGDPEDSASCIHLGFRHVQRAKVLFHTHTDYATALGCMEPSHFPMIHQNGVRFHNRYAFHEDYGLPTIEAEAEALGKSMGNKDILFMCNHGTLVKSESIPLAFDELYYLERACKNIILSNQTGCGYKRVNEEVIMQASKYYNKKMLTFYAARHFYAYWNLYLKEHPDVFF